MKIFYKHFLLIYFFVFSLPLCAMPPGISGPSSATAGTSTSYSYSGFLTCPNWTVNGIGTITSQTASSCTILWTSAGTGSITISDDCNGGAVAFKSVSVSAPPCSASTPTATFTVGTNYCGNKLITYTGTPISGETWYWQTSASGTSTSNSTTSYTAVTSGTYYLRSYASCGQWSTSAQATSLIDIVADPSVVTTYTAAAICGPGTAALLASPGTASGSISTSVKWYAASTGGTALLTATSYTPSGPISTTTTYYVSTYATYLHSKTCESTTRTPISLTINSVPGAPTVSNLTTCVGDITLSATTGSGGSTTKFYTASTGGTALTMPVTINNNGTYYVSSASSAGCESTPRVSMTVTIDDSPCMNWSEQVLYDRNAQPVSDSRTYADGFGQGIQSQTIDYLSGRIWASQPIFNTLNKPAASTLPAPVATGTIFNYKKDFVTNSDGSAPYSAVDFDLPGLGSGSVNNPKPVGNDTGTLGWYYSSLNTLEPATPVTQYPYSRTHTADGPNPLVTTAAGPGDNMRMGQGHEVTSTRSIFAASELTQYYTFRTSLFPSLSAPTGNVGYKIVATDPNGKQSTTYIDADGKSLASVTDGNWNYTFYNLAGQVTATVTPNGATAGTGFVTTYQYDQIGRLIETTSADEGTSRFVYSTDGKIRFSENQEQRNATPKRFSYTNYDYLGRLVESGEYTQGTYVFEPHTTSSPNTNSVLNIIDNNFIVDYESVSSANYTGVSYKTDNVNCKDYSFIKYDLNVDVSQSNLTGQISKTENKDAATAYSYDEFGQLKWTKQTIKQQFTNDTQSVQWTNFVSTSYASGVLSNSTNNYAWNTGAFSVNSIPAGTDGWIEFRAGETSNYKMMGLSATDGNASYETINYAFYASGGGDLIVYENGVWRTNGWAYDNSDLLRIERQGSTIYYKKNGVIYYTSTVPSTTELHGDCSFYIAGSFNSITMGNSNASWKNNDGITVNGANLKRAKYSDNWDAGVFSVKSIPAGEDGYVQFRAGETNTHKMMGLSTADGNSSYTTINYAIFLLTTATVSIYENGNNPTPSMNIAYTTGDIFRVERIGSVIYYKQNGTVIYTSTIASTGELHADCSLYSVGASLTDISISDIIKTIEYTYDYFGNVVKVDYQKGKPDVFYHRYSYDLNQRLLDVRTSPDTTIVKAKYYYYLHGPLKRLELGTNVQGIDYVYNIDGSLKFINHPDPAKDIGLDGISAPNLGFQKDAFGMAMDYNSGDYTPANYTNAGSFTLAGTYPDQFGGAVKSIRWHSPTDSHVQHGYAFNYDNRYQLTSAKFGNIGGSGSYNIDFPSSEPYKEAVTNYDGNGNIQALVRNGKTVGTTTHSVANYTYNYTSATNKLASVDNTVNSTTSTLLNYSYNSIGQMIQQTEGSNTMKVSYTAYGLVKEIRDGGNKLKASYTYDDRGNRLKKTTYTDSEAIARVTLYISDALGNPIATYEQDVAGGGSLNLVEVPLYGAGRIGMFKPGVNTTFYEVTDHLGNVRAVIGNPDPITYKATLEDNGVAAYTNPRVQEMAYFKNLSSTAVTDAYMNHSAATAAVPTPNASSYTYWKNGYTGITPDLKSIGPAIGITVQPGDKLDIEAYAKFETKASYSRSGILSAMATLLGNDFVNSAPGLEGLTNASQVFNNGLTSALGAGGNGSDPSSLPFAYVYYMLYDRNFNYTTSGWKRVTSAAGFAPGAAITSVHEQLTIPQITITEPGYIYIFVSNESEDTRVWFDDLKVVHQRSNIVAGSDFYPFGMVMENREITREDYRYGYQGQYAEKDKETGWNAFELRMYDARIGRWLSPDPAGQFTSPYVGMGNNTVMGTDPSGGFCPECFAAVISKLNLLPEVTITASRLFTINAAAGLFTSGALNIIAHELNVNNSADLAYLVDDGYQPRQWRSGEGSTLSTKDIPSPSFSVSPPGDLESLIPIWGSGREAAAAFSEGSYWTGAAYTALAISDVFLVKSIATGLGRGAWKLGSHAWKNTRRWYGSAKRYNLPSFTEVHHWLISQQTIEKYGWQAWANQPWNLKPIIANARYSSKTRHLAIHGRSNELYYTGAERFFYGTPTWAKAGTISGVGRIPGIID